MDSICDKLFYCGIIPVIAINDAKDSVSLAKALIDGGINSAEVTFRTSAAEETIKRITKEIPDMLVGAGTVLTTEQVDKAINAGAKFIVSPGLNPNIIKYCISKNIPIVPGCANPSDIEAALELGLKVVKFFPAEAAGGLKMIKAMSAPYGDLKFMPTGGIDENNLSDYMKFKKTLCCGGSFMVKPSFVDNGEFDRITELSKKAIANMHGITVKNIDDINKIMTIGVNNIERAIPYFEKMGLNNESVNGYKVNLILND